MSEIQTSDTTSSDGRTSRRAMLRRMGSVGLLATAGAGLSSLLGASAASAQGLPNNGSVVPGLLAVNNGPDCNACISCKRDEFTCGPGRCSRGCCYHCQGCGHDYHACYDVGCEVLHFDTCP